MSRFLDFFQSKKAKNKGAEDLQIADEVKNSGVLKAFLKDCSVEIMPRSLSNVKDMKILFPQKTRIYLAHIEGTPFENMLAAAQRLVDDGFTVIPHIPARIIPDNKTCETWVSCYADIGVKSALLLAGGVTNPCGDFHSSMQLLETELFDKYNYTHLYIAGHPEGNKDIDPKGSDHQVMEALQWKQNFANRSDAHFAIATQFCFEASGAFEWAKRIKESQIDLPIYIGVAGPTRLKTLLKYAVNCGVGPSIRVLQKRALDIKNLLVPFSPSKFLDELVVMVDEKKDATNPCSAHFFPLGGIVETAKWIAFAQGDHTRLERIEFIKQ